MNSDVMHRRVHDGPEDHRPKANNETARAEGLNLDNAARRVLMEPAILKNLMNEVKETVATDVVLEKSRKSGFSALHLWNLRRNSRSSRYAVHARKQPRIVTGIGY